MSYTYHGAAGWIKQPNRLVKTFSSGLCLIQQEYVRRKDSVNYFDFKEGDPLLPEDADPCMDGAYIFPAPDYQDMGNGFIKCTVSAYGRVNTKGVLSVNLFQGVILDGIFKINEAVVSSKVLVEATPPYTTTRVSTYKDVARPTSTNGFLEAATNKFVIADGESLLGNISYTPKIFSPLGQLVKYPIIEDLGIGFLVQVSYNPSITDPNPTVTTTQTEVDVKGRIEIATVLKTYQSTNFGFFTEITATYFPVFNFSPG